MSDGVLNIKNTVAIKLWILPWNEFVYHFREYWYIIWSKIYTV